MRILLFGTGGHSKAIADAIRVRGDDEIIGLVSEDGTPVSLLPGLNVLGSNNEIEKIISRYHAEGAVIGIGDTRARIHLSKVVSRYLPLATVIHPFTSISRHCTLGPGTVVMAGVVVNAASIIGAGCIVNTGSTIDHDCSIGDYVHVCPGSNLAGHVTVGARTWIGIGSCVVDHINIGEDVFVTAGSTIAKNIPASSKVVGSRIFKL